jgi:methyl-accepting chemotaxis protein
MFSKLKLTSKIAGSIAVTLCLTALGGFYVTQRRVNQQAEDAFVDKLRKTDGMASTMRTYFSSNVEIYAPHYEFKNLKQVPVVVAWSVARDYAESQGMKFTTPSLHPRNPMNTADEFETEALHAFERDPDLKEYYKRLNLNGAEVMRYAQPVRLTQDCLFCHGSPAGEKGPFGYPKEGMKVGDLKGAFVVTAPVTGLAATSRANSLALLLINLCVLVAAIAVVIFVVRRLVVKPVSASAALAEEIANNNLTVADIEVTAMDEVGQAVTALNKMKNNLTSVVTAIAGTAEQLASASEEISAGAGQSAESARTQADQTQQVATAMEQMSATVVQVGEQSQKASDSARHATEAAREGGEVAEQTLANMQAINDSTKNVANRIAELGESSEQIGKIVAVINDIADQTNLLALNAAIEAARAGEQGRGFAVVADEVRKLAERTTKSTGEIASMIDSIQAETKNAVQAMETGGRAVQEGVQKTQASGEALRRIIAMSENVNEMITQIATAATEQSATTEQINSNVAQISSSTQESSSAAEQTSKACTELSNLAFDLQKLVSQFKLNSASHQTSVGFQSDEPKPKTAAARAGAR